MNPRSIDPTECWIRHIRRGQAGDTTATTLGRAVFVRDDVVTGADGLNGRQGWQTAEATRALSDDGQFKIALPNAAGDDGVLHRRRFRVLTDPDYEPGEEWLELWTDADQERPLFVATPSDYRKTKQSVELTGSDLGLVLAGSLSSDFDVWDGQAPADVLAHYARIATLALGADDLATTLNGASTAWGAAYTAALTGVAADCWEAEARVRAAAASDTWVRLTIGGVQALVHLNDGQARLDTAPERQLVGKRPGTVAPGPVSLRVVVRYDRVFFLVSGELVCEYRRPAPFDAVTGLAVDVYNTGSVVLDGVHVETLSPFATTYVSRAVPGLLPPTGLRARYFNAAGITAQNTTVPGRAARLFPLVNGDPAIDRVEPTLNATTGNAPGVPGAYAARWTGAVFLDLATSNRELRITSLVGNARVYIGRTLRGDEAATAWTTAAAATLTVADLRAWLGTSAAGWYPIVIEQLAPTAAAGIVLQDRASSGSWDVVPQTRLSPLGVYEDHVRLTPHRTVFGDVATAFGLQWRIEPRSLESGRFPGIIRASEIVGRQTTVRIDDDAVGTEVEVQGAAGDVVDAITADAAGISDPAGSGQLSARAVDYDRAPGHMALRSSYESLAEITEQPLLATRVASLLALRSSPNEQVGVRPRGQRDLVEQFGLANGPLARMDWEPGDGVILDLDSVDVRDQTPRQMTSVQWPARRDGLGVPTVGFRQRPRSVRATMKRLTAAIFGPRRTYQGSLAMSNGSWGVSSGGDTYSRLAPPADLGAIVRLMVAVPLVSGSWRIELNGTDLGTPDGAVTAPDVYDVTRALRTLAPTDRRIYARLIGGTGSYEIQLQAVIRV